jgi:hypothetical protein
MRLEKKLNVQKTKRLQDEGERLQQEFEGVRKSLQNEKNLTARLEQENGRLMRETDTQREAKEQLHAEIRATEQQIREQNIRKERKRRDAEAERTSLREQMDKANSEFEKQL